MVESKFQEELQHKTLLKGINGLKWNYIGTFIKMITQYIVVIILMRVVGPKAYGTMALALSIIALGNLLNDSGLGAFIVQTPRLSKIDIRVCFTIQILMGTLVGILVFLLSIPIASFLKNNDLAPVLRMLSIGFVLQAFGVISFNLLKRELNFKKIQFANIFSYMVSYVCIGVFLALKGWGVWSLVLSYITQTLLNSLIMYIFTRHSLKLKYVFSKKYLKYYKFGSKALTTNITNWSIDSLGTFSMGKVYGSFNLGIYNRTLTLLMYPITFIINMIQVVMFPLYSKFQDNEELTQKTFLSTTYLVALLMFPISLILYLFKYEIFELMFGQYGIACANVSLPITISLPFIALTNIGGPIFWGRGNIEKELIAQIKTLVIYCILVAIFIHFSFHIFIWVILIVYITRFLIILASVLKYISISIIEYLKAVVPALKISLITLIISLVVKSMKLGSLTTLVGFSLFLIIVLGILFSKKRNIFLPSNIEKEFFSLVLKKGA